MLMTTKKEVKIILLDVLDTHLDAYLAEAQFSRRNNSLVYTRKSDEVLQEINIQFNYKPKYQPGVDAHIYPMIMLKIPKLSEIALDMAGGNEIVLANAPEIILNQPMEMTAPKEHHVRWFATEYSEFVDVIKQIRDFIEKWAISFLDGYNSANGITKGYELNDDRLMRQQHWYIFVAAAYVLENKMNDAKKVVEERFGMPGSRKQFSSLFEYFNCDGLGPNHDGIGSQTE